MRRMKKLLNNKKPEDKETYTKELKKRKPTKRVKANERDEVYGLFLHNNMYGCLILLQNISASKFFSL